MQQQETIHTGLIKDGKTVIVQVARTVDQLSCELWKYTGERIATNSPTGHESFATALRQRSSELLTAINQQFKTKFTRILVQLVSDSDFTAGHVPALDVQEYLQEL
jgi:hypothetical protein